MELEIRNEGRVMVIKVNESRLDRRVSGKFKDKLAELINQGNKWFVLDFSDVSFIDSSGLNAIISVLKLLGSKGNLAISGTRGTVMGLFKLTRMDKVFQMFDNDQKAIESLSV